MRARRTLISLALVACASLVAACGGSGGSAVEEGPGNTKQVSIRLDFASGAEHAPIYWAKSTGRYEKAGIDLTIKESPGSSVSTKLVGTGQDTFGIAGGAAALTARTQNIPLNVIGAIMQRAPDVIATKASSGIEDATDLYDKKLGIQTKSVTTQNWRAFAELQDIDLDRIDEVPIPTAPAQALASNNVDAAIAYSFNDALQVEVDTGKPVHRIPLEGVADRSFGMVLITSDTVSDSDPELVRTFVQTTLDAYAYAFDHPDEVLDALFEQVPETKGEYNTRKLPMMLEYVKPEGGGTSCLGRMDESKWQTMQGLYVELEVLPKEIPLEELYTNEFVGC